MYGVAQRIEHRSVIRWNGGIDLPDVRFRNADVLSEGAVGINPDDLHELADVGLAGAALEAFSAGDVHLGGDEVTLFHGRDLAADGGHSSAKFVSGDERRMDAALRPCVPIVYVKVGAADRGDLYLDQHVGVAE